MRSSYEQQRELPDARLRFAALLAAVTLAASTGAASTSVTTSGHWVGSVQRRVYNHGQKFDKETSPMKAAIRSREGKLPIVGTRPRTF